MRRCFLKKAACAGVFARETKRGEGNRSEVKGEARAGGHGHHAGKGKRG